MSQQVTGHQDLRGSIGGDRPEEEPHIHVKEVGGQLVWSDGLGGRDAEQRLAIMRDSRIASAMEAPESSRVPIIHLRRGRSMISWSARA